MVLELHVDEKVQSTCKAATGGCKFYYKEGATPKLKFIQPSVASPREVVNWYAIWRVSNTKDIKKLIIGGQNCNRFLLEDTDQPLNLNDAEEVSNKNWWENVPCELSPE